MKNIMIILFFLPLINAYSQNAGSASASEPDANNPEFRKNSIYYENSILLVNTVNYERIKLLSNDNLLTLSIGGGFFVAYPALTGRISYAGGGPKHYFETGAISYFTGGLIAGVMLGYRFQGEKGWIWRVPVHVTNNLDDGPLWFAIGFSVGHSF